MTDLYPATRDGIERCLRDLVPGVRDALAITESPGTVAVVLDLAWWARLPCVFRWVVLPRMRRSWSDHAAAGVRFLVARRIAP